MKSSRKPLVAALVLGLAWPALAQDSVSRQQGLPGDAVSAYSATEQVNTYIVDLREFRTDWGTKFGIAPIVKASNDSATPVAFFTHQISSQAISSTQRSGAPFPFPTYSVWNGPGFGVNNNTSLNFAGTPVDASRFAGFQSAVAFAEFGGNSNNIITALVNYQRRDPSRLYVSRIVGAVNGDNGTCNLAQVGLGHVDSDGNVAFRCDNFGTAAGCGRATVVNNNYFRVSAGDRNPGALNVLNSLGGSDGAATTRVLSGSGTVHNVCNIVPEQVAGRPIVLGSNFNNQYVREQVAGSVTSDGTHFAPGVTDQRGSLGYTSRDFPFLSSVNGVAGMLTKTTGSGGPTENINLWGLAGNGSVTGTLLLTLPESIDMVDPCTGFSPSFVGPGRNEFNHYGSQAAFRGNSQVAIGMDQEDRLLVAATADYPTPGLNNPLNYIAVARTDAGGNTEWVVAAYSGDPGTSKGKPILDGPGGNIVGYQTLLSNVTGGAPLGPSMSSPAFDSVGNIWFLSAIEIPFEGGSDFGSGLIRGVYDPANFCYDLELIFETGDVFRGVNSTRNYQIRFLSIADNDSISSGTFFAGNVNQAPHAGGDVSEIATRSPLTCGGVVVSAQIVYDVNQDGDFVRVTGSGGDPLSPDQEYNALLYVGSVDSPSRLRGTPPVVPTRQPGPLYRKR